MAILFESSTYIEELLKQALKKEGLQFEEQYRVYTGGRFSEVKYVADFMLTNGYIRLIVECDGYNYHSDRKQITKEKERDQWLKLKGYDVVHFSTNELKTNMPRVIYTIKSRLQIPCDPPKTSTINLTPHRISNSNDSFNDVLLFCYYKQTPTELCVVYRYKYVLRNIWSEERKIICTNIPADMLETTAIYLALLDLKRPVRIKIFFSGDIFHDDFNVCKKFRILLKKLNRGVQLLNTLQISWSYVGFYNGLRYRQNEPQKTMRALRSRCFQIARNHDNDASIKFYDYSNLI